MLLYHFVNLLYPFCNMRSSIMAQFAIGSATCEVQLWHSLPLGL